MLYFIILYLRNFLYDCKLLTITKFNINIISVGSLKFGGAGKTPLVEYLIKNLSNQKTAILSRGYKRKIKGFLIASENHTAFDIGDEASQILHKHPNLLIAVSENRVSGVEKLLKKNKNIKTIILDDGHQHRKLARNLNILVTEYEELYSEDKLFPLGTLRESKRAAHRANIIVITKCPKNISTEKKHKIRENLVIKDYQKIFFSFIKYKKIKNFKSGEFEDFKINEKYCLLTGIGNSKPLLNYLENKKIHITHFKYPDHHNFKQKELENLIHEGKKRKIKNLIVTEKDFYRLNKLNLSLLSSYFKVFYITIEFDFINNEKVMFNKQILKFI
tara:strand:- start:858 stop:1853 length:996 start_codon:yes stop_codon:yes gene_type:complete